MPVHFPSESGASAETPHGRSNGRTPDSVRLGFFFRDAKSRCRSELHRSGCGGSTPPSCRVWVASIAAMQRSLKPQSTGQHRGDPPFRRCGSAATGACARPQRFARSALTARKCSLHRLHFRIRGEIIIILRFERRVCRWESCRMHQFTPR